LSEGKDNVVPVDITKAIYPKKKPTISIRLHEAQSCFWCSGEAKDLLKL